MPRDDAAISESTSNCATDCASDDEDEAPLVFEHKKHVQWWLRHLRLLPTLYETMDIQRMSVSLFTVGALDQLGVLHDDTRISPKEREGFRDWVYDHQITKTYGTGFAGSPLLGRPKPQDQTIRSAEMPPYNGIAIAPINGRQPHMVYTFAALSVLALLRDDFSRLDKPGILKYIRNMQLPDGSFQAVDYQSESDLRFVYCSIAICNIFDDFSGINIDEVVGYIVKCQTYEGGFSQEPMQEAHGGSTLCAVASLAILGRLGDIDMERLVQWLAARMIDPGFNGRTGKVRDTCYSYWCGASLSILGQHGIIEKMPDIAWLLQCQSPNGGIAKALDIHCDVMHSFLALATLSMHVFVDDDKKAPAQTQAERELNIESMTVPESVRQGITQPIDPLFQGSASALQWIKDHVRQRA